MKKYKKLAHMGVSSDNVNKFHDLISERIDEYQSLGLQIEVQYQHSMGDYSVLILGYTEEEE